MELLQCNADGVRGSGKRVPRRFPVFPVGWTAAGALTVMDHIIEPELLQRYLTDAGMFIGLGRFRPANGGNKGRFKITRFEVEEA